MPAEYIVVHDERGYFRLLKYGKDSYDHVEKIITAANKEDAKNKFGEMGYTV